MADNREPMNVDVLERILCELGVEVRQNELTHRAEITDSNGILCESETPLDTLVAYIINWYSEDYKRCSTERVTQFLHLLAVSHPFNPILEKIRGCDYSADCDYIHTITSEIMHIPDDDTLSYTLVFKFFLQSVALLMNDSSNPFGADGMLVLNGSQGIGKSLFCDVLSTDTRYYRSLSVNPYQDESDLLSKTSGVFIGEFAEMEKSLKSATLEFFKAFITASKDTYRPKYGRAMNDYVRRSSYIGTCNTDNFLLDNTGNRRFWIVPCYEAFDTERLVACKNGEDDIFIQAFSQAYGYLSENGLQSFRLTAEEREQLEARNSGYMCHTELESLLKSILLCSTLSEFTIGQLKSEYADLEQFDNAKIGRTLKYLQLPQKTHKRKRADGGQTTERVYSNIFQAAVS